MNKLLDTARAAALRLAGTDGLDRDTLTTLKRDLHRKAFTALSEPMRYYSKL